MPFGGEGSIREGTTAVGYHCLQAFLVDTLKKKKKKEEGKHEFKQIFLNQILHYKIFFLNFDFMSVSHFFHFESWFPTTLS